MKFAATSQSRVQNGDVSGNSLPRRTDVWLYYQSDLRNCTISNKWGISEYDPVMRFRWSGAVPNLSRLSAKRSEITSQSRIACQPSSSIFEPSRIVILSRGPRVMIRGCQSGQSRYWSWTSVLNFYSRTSRSSDSKHIKTTLSGSRKERSEIYSSK